MRLNVDLALRKAAGLMAAQPVQAAALVAEVLAKFPSNARAKALLAEIDQRAQLALGGSLAKLADLARSGRAADALRLGQTLPSAALGSADVQLLLGQSAAALGRAAEATAHFTAAMQLQPFKIGYRIAAGNAAFLARDWDRAAQCFDAALALDPGSEDALNNLAMTRAAQGHLDEAEAVFAKAAAAHPHSAKIAYNRANALRDAGRFDAAIAAYEDALRLKPDYASAANNLGTVLHQLGRDAEAKAAYLRAVTARPDFAQAHLNLSAVHRYAADDPLVAQLERNLAASPPDQDKAQLTFALAKAQEDRGDYEQAFRSYVTANALRKKINGYDIAVDELLFSSLHRLFATPLGPVVAPPARPRPVFVLGMMRSGTTLVEQILASHSKVHGAGELEVLGRLCLPLMESFVQEGRAVDAEALLHLRAAYLAEISRRSDGKAVVVDKMPANFRWIGFIAAAFPEARIIHMQRDPVATCWSIFKNHFSAGGNGHAYDLGDIAAYWNLYRGLMQHWQAQYPDQILPVPYEDLTLAPEDWARRIVTFAGLEWEPACLDFHQNRRAVMTASASQVKRPIYKGSSEAWKTYQTHLQPLLGQLQR